MRGIAVIAFATLLGFSSCSKYDNERPTIKSFVVNDSTEPEQSYSLGGFITLKAIYEDDRELTSAEFLLRSGFQGQKNISLLPQFSVYYANKFEVSGEKQSTEQIVVLSETSIAGAYRIETFCTDAAGNESKPINYNLIITHPDMPAIDVTAISPGLAGRRVYSTAEGNLEFLGTVTDPNGEDLIQVNVEIIAKDGNSEYAKSVALSPASSSLSLKSLGIYNLPSTLRPTTYTLMLSVTNSKFHTAVQTFDLTIND